MSAIASLSRANFNREVLQSGIPVLVDFYADWCRPCRMLTPTLERLAQEFAGKVKFVKVDVDAEPELSDGFSVASIPTLVFVVNGKLAGKAAGLFSEQSLRRALTQLTRPPSSTFVA